MRVLVFVINATVQLAAAAAGFLLLLLGLNGYSGEQATPSLALYIIGSVVSALGLGGAGAFAAGRLAERKGYGGAAAAAVAVVASFVLGALILIGLFFAAVLLAEVVRGMR